MSIGKYEPIAIRPSRVRRTMFERIAPQNFTNVRKTHWCARMAAVGRLNGIHRQRPNGIGSFDS